ncbi:MAG TPA: CHASE domain-containing protein [Kiritimatiellia bacterium]|nr:CHASE domain-containing protein [Kiritimatiellia bacterium]HMO99231.1 CHASE domain-containing protein [Kiritimatiellia bacterium]HMP97481.1 CHASE domain-containing protein [Kiritimatiellia bacterium]
MSATPSSRGTTRFARLLALAVLVGGMAATLFVARIGRERHAQEVRRVFAAEAESMRNSVSRQLDLFFDVLASIGQLHELSDRISVEDFEEFTGKGMQFQRRILSAYGFVQRMPRDIRLAAEAGGEITVTEPNAEGAFIPAGDRPEYFPLVYQNPPDALAFPLHVDLAMLPGVPEAILRMHDRRGPVVARALRLQRFDGSLGYFVFSPLYQRTPDADAFLSGFTLAILWPQLILERALADVATRDILILFYDPELHPEAGASSASGDDGAVSEDIVVADRVWRFTATPSPEYLAARQSILPGVIMVSGGAITLLLAATIALLAGRTRLIEETVTARTRELKEANQRLSEAMQERMRLEAEILEISEREKQQVGQDLHDSLGQKLTGAVFLTRALSKQLAGEHEDTRAQADRINEILKESVAQVRRMARGLSPVELGHEGLSGALQRLADETSSVYGITCLLHHDEAAPSPAAGAAHHLYAIALEAVTNAIRHGQATEIVIELGQTDGQGRLEIEDNGHGFDPAAAPRGGMGLRIMQYRGTMIGGLVEIARRPGGGMNVICRFPPH